MISGRSFSVCAARIENIVNSIEGVNAGVNSSAETLSVSVEELFY